MLDDRQIDAGSQLIKRMQMSDAFNVDAYGVLELLGLDYISSDKVVDYLIEERLIRKDGGGCNITSKGYDINDLGKYIRDKNVIASGNVAAGKKSLFDWIHRWDNHQLVAAIVGGVVGCVIGSLVTYYWLNIQ